jgi:hypothetical protein
LLILIGSYIFKGVAFVFLLLTALAIFADYSDKFSVSIVTFGVAISSWFLSIYLKNRVGEFEITSRLKYIIGSTLLTISSTLVTILILLSFAFTDGNGSGDFPFLPFMLFIGITLAIFTLSSSIGNKEA